MMDEWTVPCKEVTSGEMGMVGSLLWATYLFFFF